MYVWTEHEDSDITPLQWQHYDKGGWVGGVGWVSQ